MHALRACHCKSKADLFLYSYINSLLHHFHGNTVFFLLNPKLNSLSVMYIQIIKFDSWVPYDKALKHLNISRFDVNSHSNTFRTFQQQLVDPQTKYCVSITSFTTLIPFLKVVLCRHVITQIRFGCPFSKTKISNFMVRFRSFLGRC